jgi:hypothetical protein
MSYEGETEYLTKKGRYLVVSCHEGLPVVDEGDEIQYVHNIDYTNGYNPDESWAWPAEKEEIGFEDIWHEDHYGNKYATKKILYKPGKHWQLIKKQYTHV